MDQPIPDEAFSKIPKVLWENSRMALLGKDFFVIGIKNGQNIGMQLLTPRHAKEILQQFTWIVDKYEKQYQEIEANWTPNVVSPFQIPPQDAK